jgi:hypothetical protein
MTPKGRDEDALSYPMAWIRHHDRYETQTSKKPSKAISSDCCSDAEHR